MSILKQLLDNNELYCYYDFRSGTYLDYTGNTTLTGTADTSLVKGKLIIPSTKRLTIGSLAIGTNDFSIVSKTRPEVYSKHILGATGFNLTVYGEFDLSTFFGGVVYYNSANQSKLDILRWNKIGATYNRDGNVAYYENGLSFRTIDISATSAVNKTDTYYLGYTNAGFIEYEYFLMAKRVLTDTEMAQLTAELENKKWTSKTKSSSFKKSITPREKDIIYKTENGIKADQKTYSTAGTLIDGTDLKIESGSWKIIDDTYNGEKVKALQCISSGTVSFSTSSILKQTPTESAYGEWEFVASKADASNLVFVFVAEALTGTVAQTLTYNFLHNTSEEIDLRQGGTVIIDGGATVYPKDTYYRVKITRNSSGVFALYVNDILIGSATNATYTLANFVRIDIDTGDKIILSSERGTYGIIKK